MLDATAQAELVARGEVSPGELVEEACARIERLDDALGAVPVRLFDEARAAAREVSPEAPFGGVPFLMKDVGARQIGQPYYAGNRALQAIDHRAEEDTILGARFRELGLVTVGNSSSPEFGLQSNTWPLAYGPTRNPWDPARAAGGSSGGACAAVAAGLVSVAHASDGAGSIRIPAAWCGLVGLKPSRDRVDWRHAGKGRADVEFVVARSLRDTARFLDLLRPAEARHAAPERFTQRLDGRCEPLRVGLCRRSPAGSEVDAAVDAAVRRTADRLADLGHDVREAAPEALFEYPDRALYGAVLGPLGYHECLVDLGERLGRPVVSSDVEPFLWELATHGDEGGEEGGDEGATPAEVQRAEAWLSAWAARVLAWFDGHDLLVTPTVHEPAPLLDSLDPHRFPPLELLDRMVPHMAFTEPWNATGQPALSLPLGFTSDGLPTGVQLVAGPGREDVLIAVAARLLDGERDGAPWSGRAPVLHA